MVLDGPHLTGPPRRGRRRRARPSRPGCPDRPGPPPQAKLERGEVPTPDGRPWAELDEGERADAIDSRRLAYVSSAPVNWCPGLGTVLANEEVTAEGRSERGNFPVFSRLRPIET